jgi:hypothetical protein
MVGSFAGCCARAVNGHAAAALPRSVMNSRRLFDESTRASSVGREAERLGGYKIDDHFEGRRLHHRKIGGLLPLRMRPA